MLTSACPERAIARRPSRRALLALAAIAGVTAGCLVWRQVQSSAAGWTRVAAQTLTVLKSEPLLFLVTDRLVTQIVVSSREYNLLLGQREGYLIATVRLYYGVDLAGLTPANLRRAGGRMVVTIPVQEERNGGHR